MVIEKERFVNYRLQNEEKPDIFTIRLNAEERRRLNQAKEVLEQPKDSTALKLLAEIGYNVLQDQKTGLIIRSIFINKKNNQITGAFVDSPSSNENVTQN